MADRQISLDTETTGISPKSGHRIIEIGAVELINRRLTGETFHFYLQPDRSIDIGAMKVHGITNEFLEGKPRFPDIVESFKDFVKGAELIIHNAPFDVGFINHELNLISDAWKDLSEECEIIDTLVMARAKHPGQKNNLDALCRRYQVDNGARNLHGALLDAQILSDVYLAMTGGQAKLALQEEANAQSNSKAVKVNREAQAVHILHANEAEIAEHEATLKRMEKISGVSPLWSRDERTNQEN